MYIADQFTIAKTWSQSLSPSNIDLIKILRAYIHQEILHNIEKVEILSGSQIDENLKKMKCFKIRTAGEQNQFDNK